MIVVTTPTGQIGRQLVDRLLTSGKSLRLIARDPNRLDPGVRERVEVVQGSHSDADVVDKAFAGADTVFWLPVANFQAESLDAAYLDFTRPACTALKTHGVTRVVGISAVGRGFTTNAGYVTASLAMDDMIAATGVHHRALTMPSFMDNMLRQAESIKDQGVFFGTEDPDRKAPTCATRDIAAAAAKLLIDDTWTGTGSVSVLGPEDLTLNEQAEIMSEVLARPVRYQQIPVEDYRANLLANGFSEAMAAGMVDMMVAKNNGLDNIEPRTPESSSPTTFREWCQDVLKPAVLG